MMRNQGIRYWFSLLCFLGLLLHQTSALPLDENNPNLASVELHNRAKSPAKPPKPTKATQLVKPPVSSIAKTTPIASSKPKPVPVSSVVPTAVSLKSKTVSLSSRTSSSSGSQKTRVCAAKAGGSKISPSKPTPLSGSKNSPKAATSTKHEKSTLSKSPTAGATLERRANSLAKMTNTPAGIMKRIKEVVNAVGAKEITAHPSFANSFQLSTSEDHKFGTKSGLQGCTIVVSYNSDFIYLAHLWEAPGFTINGPHTVVEFDNQVLGFLAGTPGADGQGPSLFDPTPGAVQPMAGATTKFITVGAKVGNEEKWDSPAYNAEINQLRAIAEKLGGTVSPNSIYRRPDDEDDPVRVTLEFNAVSRQLRVLYSDDRTADGTYTGIVAIDVTIPEAATS